MKKQICFSGITGAELEALQSALRDLSDAWECVFCADAPSTLAALASQPFDALVTNQRLEGMSGAVLLHLAANRFPRTLRFVIGNMADQQLVINSIGATHQFISSPWEPGDVIAILHRSVSLDTLLSNDKLRNFAPRLGKLPSVPSTYFEILKTVDSPNVSTESVGEIIARDPALTARLLQMTNSAACGLSQKVTSPLEAVSMLGLDAIKSLVLCLHVYRQAPAGGMPIISLDKLWRRSFVVGTLAAKITQNYTGDDRMASEAFTAGLLHKVGQIILATNLTKEYRPVVAAGAAEPAEGEIKRSLQEVEMAELGVTSDQVGAYLLGLWGLPLSLVEAVGLYSAPGRSAARNFSLLTALHIAVALADEEHGVDGGWSPAQLDADYLGSMHLPILLSDWRRAAANEDTAFIFRDKTKPEKAVTEEKSASAEPHHEFHPDPEASAFPLGRIFACAAIIVIGLIIVIHRSANTPLDVPMPDVPPLAALRTLPTAPPPNKSAFESIKLDRIIYHADRSLVVINGQTLGLGEKINGAEIVSIDPSSVTLSHSGEQKILTLK